MTRLHWAHQKIGVFCRRALVALLGVILFHGEAGASVIHIVRPGDTVDSLAQEYYGDAHRAAVLRGANNLPLDEEITLAVGEPLIIPEGRQRAVAEGEGWADLARIELGTAERAWYLAEVNNSSTDEGAPGPTKGQIVTVPYLLPLALTEGLAATVQRFFPNHTNRDRLTTARLLLKLNPGLRPRGMARGTRIVLPLMDLTILPAKRASIEREQAALRSDDDQNRQRDATVELERLAELLSAGSYIEVIELSGRIAGSTQLTEAQRISLHRSLGQALLAVDRPDLALREFTALVALQPDFQFDQVTTSPTVLRLLDRARREGGHGNRRERNAGAVNER